MQVRLQHAHPNRDERGSIHHLYTSDTNPFHPPQKWFAENETNPEAQSTETPAIIHHCIEQLIEYFAGNRQTFDLPIHQDGTEFQERVWGKLSEIPFGATMSYGELAKKMGDPKVVRAAAAANGKNKLMILAPCHRVIGADRSLVGYAGGMPKKKWLLQHEFRIKHGVQTLF